MASHDSHHHSLRETTLLPRFAQIANDLKDAMRNGTLVPGDRLPSFTTIARQYSVTQNTIERALAILEKEGLIRRERGRGVFVESLKKNRTGYIGLFLSQTEDYYNDFYTREFVKGVQAQAREYNLSIVLIDGEMPLRHREVDGILFYCNHLEAATVELPLTLPRVLLLERAASIEMANVVADDAGGAKMATQHLLKLGHRRISYMLVTDYDTYSPQRLTGYQAALEEAEIEFDPSLVSYLNEKFPLSFFSAAETAMKRWLAQGWCDLGSTAIVAPNDLAALGIIKALEETRLRVPQDVSVVGFDNVSADPQTGQQLTTVHVPLRQIGASGVQLLWEQIQQGGHQPTERVIPVQLRIGKSTAPTAVGTGLPSLPSTALNFKKQED